MSDNSEPYFGKSASSFLNKLSKGKNPPVDKKVARKKYMVENYSKPGKRARVECKLCGRKFISKSEFNKRCPYCKKHELRVSKIIERCETPRRRREQGK